MYGEERGGRDGVAPGGAVVAWRQKPTQGLENSSKAIPYEAVIQGEVEWGSLVVWLLDPGTGCNMASTVWEGMVSSYCSSSLTFSRFRTPLFSKVGGGK